MTGIERTTLVDVLRQVAQEKADEPAFRYLPDGEREADAVTFGQLDVRARALAAQLRDRGLAEARAVLSGPPGIDFVVALAGCFYAGVTAVPVVPENSSYQRRRQRLQQIITDCSPAIELTWDTPSPAESTGTGGEVPRLSVNAVDSAAAAAFTPAPVTGDTLAILQYTSGSTAVPRGVMVSHRNVLANLRMLAELFDQPPDVPTVNWLPLHHDMGLFGNVLRSLYSGRQCVLMPPTAFLRRPMRWLRAIDRYGAFVSGAPNFAYDMCVRRTTPEERASLDLSRWKVAFNGSEPVRAETLERFSEAFAVAGFDRRAFLPGYGLAEATLVVSGVNRDDEVPVHALSAEALRRGEVVPVRDAAPGERSHLVSCGPPRRGIEVAIVDPETRRSTPPDGVGEIWVRGACVAAGYWGRPEESAEVFGGVLAGDAGEHADGGPYLRTGDLGCLIDGGLVVTGRLKDLIIIRGANYYPHDIEHTVRGCLDPTRAGSTAVFAVTEGGDERLVVVQEIRAAGLDLGQRCDEIHKTVMAGHGIGIDRIVLVRRGQVPKTSSGKVQRARCRDLLADGRLTIVYDDRAGAGTDPGDGSTRSSADRPVMDESFVDELRGMVSLLVGRPAESISAAEPLTAARVDSLHAAELQERLHQRFAVEVELADILGGRTLRELAELVYAQAGPAADAAAEVTDASVVPATTDLGQPGDPFPLTGLQEAYLAGRTPGFELGGVGTHAYLEYHHGDLDVERVAAAWRTTVRRHDMLRAVFTEQGQQRILSELDEPVHIDDLRAVPDVEAELEQTRKRMSQQVLDPYAGPLFEVRISRLPGDEVVLHLSFDLIILDASGVLSVLREWGEHYRGTGNEGPVSGPSFREFILRRRDRRDAIAEHIAEALRQRGGRLHPGPGLPLAVDPAGMTRPVFRRRHMRLDPAVWQRLGMAAQTRGVTRAALLGAAFSEVLALYSEQRPFTLTVTSFDRPIGQVGPEVVGEFTSLLLVPVEAGRDSFETRLHSFSRELASALQQRDIDGVALLRERMRTSVSAAPPRPLAPVVFTCLLEDTGDLSWLGTQRYAISQTPQVWLDHQVILSAGAPDLVWDAVEELFPDGLLDSMFETYLRLLGTLADRESWQAAGRELAGLPTLAGHTESAVLHGSDQLLPDLIEAQVRRTPDAEAVISNGWRISYRELATAGRLVARRLIDLGLAGGDLVIIALDKGWEQVAAVHGVLLAGGGYVPVDPAVTDKRFRQVLADSGARMVVTDARLARERPWGDGARHVSVDELWRAGLDQAVEIPPGRDRQPGDLAYIIYTSGSTGQPKGVAIGHHSAVNTVLDINDRFSISPQDQVFGVTPLTFDLSVYDIFGPLSAGGSLLLPDHERRGQPGHWVDLMCRERVTVWNSVPALLRLLVDDPAAADRRWAERLRLILLSGDWIGVDFAAEIRRGLPHTRLVSLGGATEGSIWSVLYEIDEVDPGWRSIPYGTAMRGQGAVVLDDDLEPRPLWVPGPLYLSGAGLAREYWRDPARTAASFPVHPGTGRRLYRTGDIARLLPDGNLELLGREDTQIKVQGHRIEPGEVEAALVSHPAVVEAVVGALGPRDGVRRLVAYARLTAPDVTSAQELRDYVAGILPRYLVPDAVRLVETLPLTGNGKVDRNALFDATAAAVAAIAPAPPAVQPAVATVDNPAVTQAVLRIVGGLAGGVEVTATARFADLEFTSVHQIRLANALEAEFGSRPRLDELYRMRDVTELIQHYTAVLPVGSPPESAASAAGAAQPPLSAGVAPRLAPARPVAAGGDRPGAVVLADPVERAAFKQRWRARPAPTGTGIVIQLPDHDQAERQDLLARRTAWTFASEPVAAAELATWLGCLREHIVDGRPRYAWGSAGGLYPVDVYLQINGSGVRGLSEGVYHYDPRGHALSLMTGEPLVSAAHHAADNQRLHRESAFAVFLVADLDAVTSLYGELAERFCLIEAGGMGHLLETQAPRRGLITCPIGVVDFSAAAAGLHLKGGQRLVYTLLGGRPTAPRATPRTAPQTAPDVVSTPRVTPPAVLRPAATSQPTEVDLAAPYRAVPATALRAEAVLRLPPLPAAGANERPTHHPAVLVTGGTGFFGAYLVADLLATTDATVYGLVRAPDAEAARRRLLTALRRYGREFDAGAAERLIGVAGDLAAPRLGLPPCGYERLSAEIGTVYHSGASVHWGGSYQRLAPVNVAGTRRIIDFATDTRRKRLVHVSTVAVFPFGGRTAVTEDSPLEHGAVLYGGYPQSKWVAEKLVQQAAAGGLDVTVLRPGSITGDSSSGVYNPTSFLDLFLTSCAQLGWAPELDMSLDMTPVDYASAAAVALTARSGGAAGPYHLTNPAPPRLSEVYDVIETLGHPLRRESFESWRARVLDPAVIAGAGLAPFADYLRHAREEFLRMPRYDSSRTVADLDHAVTCPPVDEKLIRVYFDAYARAGYLATSRAETGGLDSIR